MPLPTFQVQLISNEEKVTVMDYTPGSAVAAGEVIVIVDLVGIAPAAIAANALGQLHIGGGIYLATGDAAIPAGTVVYWDNTNNRVTVTATGNKKIGKTLTACGGNNQTCQIHHVNAV